MKDHTARDVGPEFQLLHDALNATPIGILLAELEGRLLFANQALCSMLGFSEEEIRSKNWMELSPPEDAARDQALFGQLRAGSTDHITWTDVVFAATNPFFRRTGAFGCYVMAHLLSSSQ